MRLPQQATPGTHFAEHRVPGMRWLEGEGGTAMRIARDFKDFILRGNVVDLAVGIVIEDGQVAADPSRVLTAVAP